MTPSERSDSRLVAAGLRAAETMEAMEDPEVVTAHDAAGLALHKFGGLLIEHGVEPRMALQQMIAIAVSAFWRGAVEE